MKTKPYRGWLILGVVILTMLACSLTNPTPVAWVLTPTAEAAAAFATSAAKTRAALSNPNPLAPLPTATPPVFPTETPPASQLSPSGPWLLYTSEGGAALILRNADGSGRTRLALPDPLLDPADLTNGLSPQGDWLAVRTGKRPGWTDLAIQLIHLPDGATRTLTPLLSPTEQRDPLAVQSVAWRDALRWSPDGHYLAFIAAVDGSSSDLYVYDSKADKIQRLTTGSYQAATPFWSPDSTWVITQEMSGLASTNPVAWKLNDVWAVNLTSGEFRKLYTPDLSSDGEVFLGWVNDLELLFYSHRPAGPYNLRKIDIDNLKVTPVLEGGFGSMVMDPASKVIAFTRREGASLPAGVSPGFYQMQASGQGTTLVQAGDWAQLAWSAQTGTFLATGPLGALVVSPQGSAQLYANEPNGLPSDNGKWMACWGGSAASPGLRLYQPGGQPLQTILADPVQDLAWAPDASGLFALSNQRLIYFTFPDLQPSILEDSLQPAAGGAMQWVSARP